MVWQGGVRCDSVAREEFKEPVSLGRKGFTLQMNLGEKDLKGLSALRLKSQLQSIPPSILSSILPLIVPSISLSIHQFVAVQDASTPIRPCTQPLRFQSAISFPPQSSNPLSPSNPPLQYQCASSIHTPASRHLSQLTSPLRSLYEISILAFTSTLLCQCNPPMRFESAISILPSPSASCHHPILLCDFNLRFQSPLSAFHLALQMKSYHSFSISDFNPPSPIHPPLHQFFLAFAFAFPLALFLFLLAFAFALLLLCFANAFALPLLLLSLLHSLLLLLFLSLGTHVAQLGEWRLCFCLCCCFCLAPRWRSWRNRAHHPSSLLLSPSPHPLRFQSSISFLPPASNPLSQFLSSPAFSICDLNPPSPLCHPLPIHYPLRFQSALSITRPPFLLPLLPSSHPFLPCVYNLRFQSPSLHTLSPSSPPLRFQSAISIGHPHSTRLSLSSPPLRPQSAMSIPPFFHPLLRIHSSLTFSI